MAPGATTGNTTGSSNGATTGTTTETASGAATRTTTNPAGYRDGTYIGTIHVDIEDIGFVVNYDSCDAPLTLIVAEAAVPQIMGSTTCYPQGILAGQDLVIQIEGSIPADPMAQGTASLNWTPQFMPVDNWNGSFIDYYTLEGAFDGVVLEGVAGFGWDATFSVSRVVPCFPAPSETPTETPTATPTPTLTPTATPVPEGGACTETSQCESGLRCVDGICALAAPAPAASRGGLLAGLAALTAVAAWALWRRSTLE